MAATTADLVQKFIDLDQQRKAKERDVETLKEEITVLETELLQRFEHAGMQSMKSASGVTVYIHRQIWAGAQDGMGPFLPDALRGIGLGDLVQERVNTQTFSAWVREQAKASENGHVLSPEEIVAVLPESLRPIVNVTEKYSLRARKG